jgi:hypothetical protein
MVWVSAQSVRDFLTAEMSQKLTVLCRRKVAVRLRISIDMSLFLATGDVSEKVLRSSDKTVVSLRKAQFS